MKISLRHQFVLAVAPLALLLVALVAVLVGGLSPVRNDLEEIEEDLAETVHAEDVSTSLADEMIGAIQGQESRGCEKTLAALAQWRALAGDDAREYETHDDLETLIRRFDTLVDQEEPSTNGSSSAARETSRAETLTLFDRAQAVIRRMRSKEELDLGNRIASVGGGIPGLLQSPSLRRDITDLQFHLRATATGAMFLRAVHDEMLAYELATLSPEDTSRPMIDARIYSARTEAANLFDSWNEAAARYRTDVREGDQAFEQIVREYERFTDLSKKLELQLQQTGHIERQSLQGLQRLAELVDEFVDSEHASAREVLNDVERSTEMLIVSVSVSSVAAIALAIGLSWVFGRRLIRALASFEKSARQVRDGQLSARLDVHSSDELGQAASSFNAMAEDLQNAATARAQSDERFRLAAQATKDIIWDWDLASGEIRVNEASKRLLGFDEPGTLPLMAWYNAIHPDDVERVRRAIREALKAGAEIWSDQYRFRRADGSHAFVLDRASIVRTDDGNPVRLIGAMVDITAQKEALQAIADLNRRNELILDSVADGIVGFDLAGNIIGLNPAAGLALGSDLTKLRGKQIHASLHGQDAAHDWSTCPFRTALASAEAQRNDADSFQRADGTRIAAEYVCSAIQDEDGSVHGAVLAFRDVSERTALQRMKAEFVSTVSHELRTPLTSIRGSLGLLASGILGKTSERGQRMLDIAISNTDRLVRLINDILDIERLDSGRGVLTLKRIDSGELIEQAIEVMKSMADKAGVTLAFEQSSLPVYGNSDRLMQMLTNLVSNAIKFSDSGGEVAVRAEPHHGMVRFAVSDRGRGIPTDKLSLIFERFQQVDASDAREKGGTGLGLAICRGIVQQHGGRIWVESVVGEGSAFYFTVPLDISDHSEASPHDVAPILARNLR